MTYNVFSGTLNLTQSINPSLEPKWHLDQFSRFFHRWLQSVPILYNLTPIPPSKLPLPMGDLDSHLIHGSLDPPESSVQTASWSVQLFLQGSVLWQTDRQTNRLTNRPRHSVGNNRPHLHTYYGRCNLKIYNIPTVEYKIQSIEYKMGYDRNI